MSFLDIVLAGRSRVILLRSACDSMLLLLIVTNLCPLGGPLDPEGGLCAVAHTKVVSHIYSIF